MANDFGSIEDLMSDRQQSDADDTPKAQEALQEKMHEMSEKRKEEETAQRAVKQGLPYMDLHGFPILLDAIRLVPKPTAEELQLVCFLHAGDQIRLGIVHENKLRQAQDIAKDLQKRFGADIVIYMISDSSFQSALKYYDLLPKKIEAKGGVEITAESITKYQSEIQDFTQLAEKIQQVSLSEVIVIVLASAIKMDASDVHIEAGESGVTVRFRVDGVLHDVAEVASSEWGKLVSRLKLVSHLKLNVTNRPQDGRFTIFLADDKVEVRVSTIPTAYGESVVMRLLKASSVGLQFDDLGFRGKAYERLQEQIKRPNGMIIATGPTGSGKTTTLYAILNVLNQPETKVITLEDPIEYKLEGINQSQVDASKDYTFAKGLRSLLRQDPDIVMVGEIRDNETADIAVNAALTGHLVVSTLHTNSAAGAIPRFVAMETKPFLLAPALNVIIGQRLVRRLCQDCKQEHKPDEETLKRVIDILQKLPAESGEQVDIQNLTFYKGAGCDACHGLGYKGRIGIYEAFIISQDIEHMVLNQKVSEYDLQEKAVEEGMITMVQDGLLKAKDGITSLEEVFKQAE